MSRVASLSEPFVRLRSFTPVWNKPTITSGRSFFFTTSIHLRADCTASSKRSPLHSSSDSHDGTPGVMSPMVLTILAPSIGQLSSFTHLSYTA